MSYTRLKLISGIILALCLIILSWFLIPIISDTVIKNESITQQTMENTINKALIHCYAIEGAYPASLTYLSDNYGITLQEERFYYYYEFIGSNIRPIVQVHTK